jgi:hypothetical protein
VWTSEQHETGKADSYLILVAVTTNIFSFKVRHPNMNNTTRPLPAHISQAKHPRRMIRHQHMRHSPTSTQAPKTRMTKIKMTMGKLPRPSMVVIMSRRILSKSLPQWTSWL